MHSRELVFLVSGGDGGILTLRQSDWEKRPDLPDASALARFLRPVKDEPEAVRVAAEVLGSGPAIAAEKSDPGIVARAKVRWPGLVKEETIEFVFDRAGKLSEIRRH